MLRRGPGSVVSIATGYGLDGPGMESRWGRDFSHLSRPVLGPIQPTAQWVPGLFPGVKSGRDVTLTPHPLLVPWSRKGYSYTSTPPYGPYGLYRASVPVQWWTLLVNFMCYVTHATRKTNHWRADSHVIFQADVPRLCSVKSVFTRMIILAELVI